MGDTDEGATGATVVDIVADMVVDNIDSTITSIIVPCMVS